jgi:hypothetical protein
LVILEIRKIIDVDSIFGRTSLRRRQTRTKKVNNQLKKRDEVLPHPLSPKKSPAGIVFIPL